MKKSYKTILTTIAVIILSVTLFSFNINVVRADTSNSKTIEILELLVSLDIFSSEDVKVINFIIQILKSEGAQTEKDPGNSDLLDSNKSNYIGERPVDPSIQENIKSKISFKENRNGVNIYTLDLFGANTPNVRWHLDSNCLRDTDVVVNGNEDRDGICWSTQILYGNSRNGDLENIEISIKKEGDDVEKIEFWFKAYNEDNNLVGNISDSIEIGETQLQTDLYLESSDSTSETIVFDGGSKTKMSVLDFYIKPDGNEIALNELNVGLRYGSSYRDLDTFIEAVHLYDRESGKIYTIRDIKNVSSTTYDDKTFSGLDIDIDDGEKYKFTIKVDVNEIEDKGDLNYWANEYLYLYVDIDTNTVTDSNMNKVWKMTNPIYKTIKIDVTPELRQEWMG